MYLLCIEPPEGGLPEIIRLQSSLIREHNLLPVWYPWMPLAISENIFNKNDYSPGDLKNTAPLRFSKIEQKGNWIFIKNDSPLHKDLIQKKSNSPWPTGEGFCLGTTEKTDISDIPVHLYYRSWKLICHKLIIPEGHQVQNGGLWDMKWEINIRSSRN